MTDPILPPAPSSGHQLTEDAMLMAQLGARILDAKNAGGAPAVMKELGLDLPQLEQAAGDVVSNLPALKAGWRTSEFWVSILSLPLVNVLWWVLFKTHATTDVNGAVTVLAASYVGSRAVVKHAATATMKTAQVSRVETVSPSGDSLKSTTREITSSGPAPTATPKVT